MEGEIIAVAEIEISDQENHAVETIAAAAEVTEAEAAVVAVTIITVVVAVDTITTATIATVADEVIIIEMIAMKIADIAVEAMIVIGLSHDTKTIRVKKKCLNDQLVHVPHTTISIASKSSK